MADIKYDAADTAPRIEGEPGHYVVRYVFGSGGPVGHVHLDNGPDGKGYPTREAAQAAIDARAAG